MAQKKILKPSVLFFRFLAHLNVGDFPWHAALAGGLGVDDGALVAIAEGFTETVDLIDWGTLTSSDVIVEVAPASVFVDGFDERGSPSRSERSGHGVVGHEFLEVFSDLVDVGDGDGRESTVENELHFILKGLFISDQF